MKKNKGRIFAVSVIVNILLAVVLFVTAGRAGEELRFSYVEKDTIMPDTIRKNLERENYGVAASLSHPIRGGAEIAGGDLDYYMLGEYADLLFLKRIFAEAGNTATLQGCEERLAEIREAMPEYGSLFDKIDLSAENALPE